MGYKRFDTNTASEREWRLKVRGILKVELKRNGVTYAELAEKLTAMGFSETERNITNKLSRGAFSGVFFVQCLLAIGVHKVRLHDAD
jgi:hypothetical protein